MTDQEFKNEMKFRNNVIHYGSLIGTILFIAWVFLPHL